jgi:hypothetical protein
MIGVEPYPYHPESRQDYHRTAGFALYNDVNDHMLHDIAGLPDRGPISQATASYHIPPYSGPHIDNPAGASLYLATQHIVTPVETMVKDPGFYSRYGVSGRDRRAIEEFDTHAIIKHGFDVLHFPWLIGAAVANACVDEFVEQNVITRSQKNAMNLHDWANVIGSGWFARLSHSMALGKNDTYRGFSMSVNHYAAGSLKEHFRQDGVIGPEDEVFSYEPQAEPEEGMVYATVKPSKAVIAGLRRQMRNAGPGDSGGCPVARNVVWLPTAALKADPHVKNLLKSGGLEIRQYNPEGTHVQVAQDMSAIEKTLALMAMQLDNYADLHGTPEVSPFGDGELTHRRTPAIDALRWPVADIATQENAPATAQPRVPLLA